MKKKFLFLVVLSSIFVGWAYADPTQDVLDSSVVKSTFALMQMKHEGRCKTIASTSVHWMCTGAIPPVTKLEIHSTGCGFAVELNCPGESAMIFGKTQSVYATDPSGVRNDVARIDLGMSFTDISFLPVR